LIVQGYLIICVIRIVMSWLDMGAGGSILSSIATISYALTEPVFATVRQYMPSMGDLPIDISPMIVILGLSLLRGLIC